MDAQLLRLLPILLVFLSEPARGASHLHPVILVPGFGCSQINARLTDEYARPSGSPSCGARKGAGWFRLWNNSTAAPALAPCYTDQLRLVYDSAAGDYRDVPGVDTRVVSFGTTHGFSSNDPSQKDQCMGRVVEALEGIGYREGENLFGAPYDFRHGPAPPGVASRAFSDFLSRLRLLVERASKRGGDHRQIILLTHSFGGTMAMEFLNRSPTPWRARYVKHLVMVAAGDGGSVAPLQIFASSIGDNGNPSSSPGGLVPSTTAMRTFSSMLSLSPSPTVFGHAPLVITRAKNYSAYEIPEFLSAVGFSDDEVESYRTRELPLLLNFRTPSLPITMINGQGTPTAEKLVYLNGNFSSAPQVVYFDGDGVVSLTNVLALRTLIAGDLHEDYFKSVIIHNVTHTGLISDDFALQRVVNEIRLPNQAVY